MCCLLFKLVVSLNILCSSCFKTCLLSSRLYFAWHSLSLHLCLPLTEEKKKITQAKTPSVSLKILSLPIPTGGIGASQVAQVVKNLPANAGDLRDMGSIPELGRSPGGEHGNPLQ